jgi:hypothetical protein
MAAPTLCYQCNYPRSPNSIKFKFVLKLFCLFVKFLNHIAYSIVRWGFIGRRIGQMVFLIAFAGFMIEQV